MIEHSEIRFGLIWIPFQIRRSTKRGTLALTIDVSYLVVTTRAATTIDRLTLGPSLEW